MNLDTPARHVTGGPARRIAIHPPESIDIPDPAQFEFGFVAKLALTAKKEVSYGD